MHDELRTLVVIAAIAAAVPFIVGLLRIRIAQVVILLALGVIFGPQVLGLIEITDPIALLSELGMGFLFFLAGLEIERRAVTGADGRLAIIGWGSSILVGAAIAWTLAITGAIVDGFGVAIALTTSALGTLLPVLRDAGQLETPFGRLFMGAAAWGEFGPIIAIAILLGTKSPMLSVLSLTVFAAIATIFLILPGRLRSPSVERIIEQGRKSSSQTAIRLVMLVLLALLWISSDLGIDAVLGAFVAGIIVKRFASESDESGVEKKIEAIAFGFFIPLFFVVSGATLDIRSIIENPLRLIAALVAILVARGLPQLIVYRRALPDIRSRGAFSLYVATGLPLLVAITSIEVAAGAMEASNAASLVGAGALSVLLFPLGADLLLRRSRAQERAAKTA